MPKIIESPVKHWPGQVIISSPLTMPQYLTWIEAATKAETLPPAQKVGVYLPGVMACVEKWHLGGGFPQQVTADTFPATPAKTSLALLMALISAIWDEVNAEDEPPNA